MSNPLFIYVCTKDPDADGAHHVYVKAIRWDGTVVFNERSVSTGRAPQSGSGTRRFTAANPRVAVNSHGTIIVVWEDDRDGNSIWNIYARGFDSNGNQVFSERRVNSSARGQQKAPDVACMSNGDFVVVWEDDKDENGFYQIYARGFHMDGTEKFHDMTVNTVATGQQIQPSISVADMDGFVIVWADDRNNNNIYRIRGRGFNADGSENFSEMLIGTTPSGDHRNPKIRCNPLGNFVVVWQDQENNPNGFEIKAKGFDGHGRERFPEIRVSSTTEQNPLFPDVGIAQDSSFVVSWNNYGSGHDVFMRGFDLDGAEIFAERQVNPISDKHQSGGRIDLAGDGKFVVLWEHDAYTTDRFTYNPEVFFRSYHPNGQQSYPASNRSDSDNTGEFFNAVEVFSLIRNKMPDVAVSNHVVIPEESKGCLPKLLWRFR